MTSSKATKILDEVSYTHLTYVQFFEYLILVVVGLFGGVRPTFTKADILMVAWKYRPYLKLLRISALCQQAKRKMEKNWAIASRDLNSTALSRISCEKVYPPLHIY